MRRAIPVWCVLLVLAGGIQALAQVRGDVSGTVKSDAGAPVAGVLVKISGEFLPGGRTFTTAADGAFRFLSLIPGRYVIEATAPEWASLQDKYELTIGLGKTTQVPIVVVTVGKETRDITVRAPSPDIDLKSTQVSANWEKATVEKLPLGRSYSSLFQLAPGVADNRDFAPNAGGNKQDNVFLFDGSNITNPFFGTLGANFSEMDIAEFSITRGGISAEFGRSAGMVTNAITKSGSNAFSGSIRFVAEPAGFTAPSADPTLVTKVNQYNPALSFGGPVIKDKLWFYVSANLPRSTTTGRINNLGAVPDARSTNNELFFKLSANPSPNHLIVASIRNDDYRNANGGVGVNDHPNVSITGEGLNRIFFLSWSWTISRNTFFEAKYDHVNTDYKSVPDTDLGYQPTFDPLRLDRMGYFQTSAAYILGGATASGQYVGAASEYNTQNFFRDELKLVLTQYASVLGTSHMIKAGFAFDDGGEYLDRKANGWGSIIAYTALSASIDPLRRPGFRARYYPDQAAQDSRGRTYSIFIQDQVSVGERWTFTLGLLANRDEFSVQTAGERKTFLTFDFGQEIQPRLGVVFIPSLKLGDKLYANYGRYNNMDNRSLARAAAPLRVYRSDAYFLTDGTLLSDTPQASETGKVILPDLKPTATDEVVVGYSRPLFKDWTLELWGQYRNVSHVIEDYPTVNRLTSPSTYVYGNLDGDLYNVNGDVIASGVVAKREYTAFSLELKKRWSNRWALTAMYTWSKLYGNWDLDYSPGTSLFYASSYIEDAPGLYIEDPLRTGYMSGDRTHIFKLFGSWEFLPKLTAGAYLRAQSGRPWEARVRDYYGNYYMYLEPAGTNRLKTWVNLDLQVTYAVPLGGRFQGIIEARVMNALDTQTVMSIDVRSDQPSFRQATSYASPRKFAVTFYINF